MATLIGLGLENFRVFKEYTEFDFAPITLLTGANNSGKSSLIKALLLLADNTGKRKNLLEELDFSGELTDLHNLGSFDLALNNTNGEKKDMEFQGIYKKDNAIFKLILNYVEKNGKNKLNFFKIMRYNESTGSFYHIVSILLKEQQDYYSSFIGVAYFLQENFSKELRKTDYFDENDQDSRNINFIDEEIQKKIELINTQHCKAFLKELNDVLISWLSLQFIPKNRLNFGDYVQKHLEKLGEYSSLSNLEKFKKFGALRNNPDYKSYFSFLTEEYLIRKILKKKYAEYLVEIPQVLSKLINELIENIDFEFETSIRANSKRFYIVVSQGTLFNDLLVKFNKMKFAEKSKEQYFINKWLQKFEIADRIKFFWREAVGTEIKLYKNNKELDLADLGFGVTQLLPILMRIVMCKTNYLILEEPENSLHPNLQSKLADLLIDASKPVDKGGFGIRFIVETHSEYLIRKLRVLTKKGVINKEDAVIYYFQNPENLQESEKLVRKIQINHDGFMTDDFGNGFTDESDNLMIELYDLPNRPN